MGTVPFKTRHLARCRQYHSKLGIQLFFRHWKYCIRKDTKERITRQGPIIVPPKTMGATINNESTTTGDSSLSRRWAIHHHKELKQPTLSSSERWLLNCGRETISTFQKQGINTPPPPPQDCEYTTIGPPP